MGELIKFNSGKFQKIFRSPVDYDEKRYKLLEQAYLIAERMNKKEEKCTKEKLKH